jgi:hypothetical protein
MPKTLTPKSKGRGLEVKTFKGGSGLTYLVFKTLEGGFHVFVETEAKKAAVDCTGVGRNTRQKWESIW